MTSLVTVRLLTPIVLMNNMYNTQFKRGKSSLVLRPACDIQILSCSCGCGRPRYEAIVFS